MGRPLGQRSYVLGQQRPAVRRSSVMGFSSGYRDLVVWQEAMNLAILVYQFSSDFPKQETYGLTTQVRRAAVSIPSNIAEGAARNSARELHHFLGIASGSLAELATQLELAERLKYVHMHLPTTSQIQRVGMLLQALRRSCNND